MLLNVILKVGNDKMRRDVLCDANRDAYPNLVWPEKPLNKSRAPKKADKSSISGRVRRVWIYCNVCKFISSVYVGYIRCLSHTGYIM